MANQTRLLELALKGLEIERRGIEKEIADIRQQLGNGVGPQRTTTQTPAARSRKRGRLSAAGRKAISDALKRRWAEKRKAEVKASR